MTSKGAIGLSGELDVKVIRAPKNQGPVAAVKRAFEVWRRDAFIPEEVRQWNPRSHLGQYVRSILHYLPREAALELVDRLRSCWVLETSLQGVLIARNPMTLHEYRGWAAMIAAGESRIPLGVLSTKVTTTVSAEYIVDKLVAAGNINGWNFHGIGKGATAPAITDTALGTELTTQYTPDNTRATGVQSEASSKVYQTQATNTISSGGTGDPHAITEHGVFSQAATGGAGTQGLLDRHTFAAVNLSDTDGLQTTYQLTVADNG